MEEIIEKLQFLNYPFPINDMNLFYQSLISPTKLRLQTIEWLFNQMEPQLLNKILSNFDSDENTRILTLFRIYNIIDTKDNILGLSTEINNIKVILNLINFTIKYIKINNNNSFFTEELKKSLNLIYYINENKLELFKKDIRLFIPNLNEKNNITEEEQKKYKLNINKTKENINTTKDIINKIEGKIEKLKNLNLNYERISREDELELKTNFKKFEKEIDIFLKDFNQLYEKELKYISPEKISNLHSDVDVFNGKYKHLENIAILLEQIYALHNKICNIEEPLNEK